MRKQVWNPDGGALVRDTRFVLDGTQEVEEQDWSSGATTTTYVWSPVYVDELVEFTNASGSHFAHQDARCDVVAVTNAAGAVVERRRFDDFGRVEIRDAGGAVVAASPSGLEYGFQGRRLDPETGLIFFRARYYSPETGRFVQRDPVWDAGNVGGQYTFCGNGPESGRDPGGTKDHRGWLAKGWEVVSGVADQAATYAMRQLATGVEDLQTGGILGPLLKPAERLGQALGQAALQGQLGNTLSEAGRQFFYEPNEHFVKAMRAFEKGEFEKGGGEAFHAIRGYVEQAGVISGVLRAPGALRNLLRAGRPAACPPKPQSYCFVAGTLVCMADGSVKAIEDVHPGDEVLSCDPSTGTTAKKLVTDAFVASTNEVVSLTLVLETADHGQSPVSVIHCTPAHPFWVIGAGWVEAGSLRPGDTFLGTNGESVRVVGHKTRHIKTLVYNFKVADWHCYFVGAETGAPFVLAHNKPDTDLSLLQRGRQQHGQYPRSRGANMRELEGRGYSPMTAV